MALQLTDLQRPEGFERLVLAEDPEAGLHRAHLPALDGAWPGGGRLPDVALCDAGRGDP